MSDSDKNIDCGSSSSRSTQKTQPSPSTMSVLRTPEACFDNLPLWNYEPQYFTSTLYGLKVRIAYYDLGEEEAEETILLTHGMSSWSYLYLSLIHI